MPRYPEFAPLYDAFQAFLHNCLLNDRSLLWPQQVIWTPENVAAVKTGIVDHPDIGDSSFDEKLEAQMKQAPKDGWGVLADVFYVYYLPSRSITYKKKREKIAFAAEKGSLILPPETDKVWMPLQSGFCHTGQHYHLKFAQFWAVLKFANAVKAAPDRRAILEDPDLMQKTMDAVLESIPNKGDRALDMRHAMLHLAFPDQFEPIISTQDKLTIVKTFGKQVTGKLPDDPEQALLKIRQFLAPEKDQDGEPFHFYRSDIKAEWKGDPPVVIKGSGGGGITTITTTDLLPLEVQQVLNQMEFTRNVILYGPPGTGKTFIAHKAAEELVMARGIKSSKDELIYQNVTEKHTFYDVLALALYLNGLHKRLAVNEILQLPLIQSRFRVRPVSYPREAIWGTLQNHTAHDSKTVKVSNKFGPALFDKDDSSRWVLTPSGKDYVEQNLAEPLQELRGNSASEIQAGDFIFFVTFHQSYSYEDFIEGIRPKTSGDEGGAISYDVAPGIFRRVCARAAANPDHNFVLLIDEINRGNIAKIFGEIITLIEDDKRCGTKNTLQATLPYSGEALCVPSNLYILGTMNTADRSIALLDVALRRRFAFLEVMPNPNLMGDACVVSAEGSTVHLSNLQRTLNAKILKSLGRNYQIGHSYFLKVSQVPMEMRIPILEFVWNYQVLPLLEEYFYSQRSGLLDVLKPFLVEGEEEVDADTVEIPRITGDDLLAALGALKE